MKNSKKYPLHELNQDIIIPEDWDINEDGNLISIFEPQFGVGALQLSIYLVDSSTQVNLKEEFLRIVSIPNNIQINIQNQKSFFHVEFENDEDTYWRYWLFKKNNYIVYASYNCSKTDIGKENEIVDSILKSLL